MVIDLDQNLEDIEINIHKDGKIKPQKQPNLCNSCNNPIVLVAEDLKRFVLCVECGGLSDLVKNCTINEASTDPFGVYLG